MRRKGLTSIELAKLAGVSSATISRAFTSDSRIKPQTRARILALADEHGFRPNAMARSLNNSKSRLVAIVVNTIANPAEGEGLELLIHRLQERELMPLLLCCGNHKDLSQLMRLASTYQVDHVLLHSDMVSIDDAVRIFGSASLVIASGEPLDGRELAEVRLDSARASAEIVAHLVKAGRRRFAYLSGRESSHVDKQRLHWFATALAGHGLAFEIVAHGDYSYESGYKEAVMLMRDRPEAIICANDLMAAGAADAAHRVGVRTPDELVIVGHDGVAFAGWDSHSLTTITPPPGAVRDALVACIENPDSTDQHVIDCVVRWGNSTGPR
jgi:DNA-binding LacI/PurR family transcriptional regulator